MYIYIYKYSCDSPIFPLQFSKPVAGDFCTECQPYGVNLLLFYFGNMFKGQHLWCTLLTICNCKQSTWSSNQR